MTETPRSLLERLRQPREAEAWDRFVSLYTPLIYAWGRYAGLQEADAEDLAQDVFLKLINVMPTFNYDPNMGFRGWLRTVTLNTWRDRRKRRGDRPLPADEAALAEVPAPDAGPSFWEIEYRQLLVKRAMTLIKTDFRPASWMAFWEQIVVGRPAGEVAAELGMTNGAAYAAKFRVLDRLRQELDGMLD